MADAGHGIDEGTPSADVAGETRAKHAVVLGDAAGAIKAAGIEHETDARKARKRERFEGAVPTAIALLVDDVGELSVGDAGVDVSVGKKAVKLCRHRKWRRKANQ